MQRTTKVVITTILFLFSVFLFVRYRDYGKPLFHNSIRLGLIRDHTAAQREAFTRLIEELRRNPKATLIAVEWKSMTFLEYTLDLAGLPEQTGSVGLEFDQVSGRFAELEPVNGPIMFDFRGVTPTILLRAAEDNAGPWALSRYGCRNALH